MGVGDLAAQAEQALEAAGASFGDVVKMTIYVARWKPELMEALGEGLLRVAARVGVDPRHPTTLIGVDVLFSPEILVEIEVTAVVD